MKVEWQPEALNSWRRHMHDQQGMHAIAVAVGALAEDPKPPEAFAWGREGDYRLRVGPYRLMYRVDGDLVLIGHVSRTED